MPAGKRDFTIEQGATFNPVIVYKDSAGNPINLTGYTARMMVRKDKEDASPILDIDDIGGEITIDGPNGKLTFNVAATVTKDLEEGKWYYDIEIESGSNVVTRLLEGRANVTREITR